MKLREVRTSNVVLLLWSCALCLLVCGVIRAASTETFDGTWKLDRAASKFNGKTVYASRTIVFETSGRGLMMRSSGMNSSGQVQAGEFLARANGKYFPVTGNIGPDEIAITQPSPSIIAFTNRKSGKVLASGRYELLDGGNRLVLVAERDTPTGKEVIMRAVFSRQR